VTNTRQYRIKARPKVALTLQVQKPSENQIQLLAEHFFGEAVTEGSDLVEAYQSIEPFMMIDILREEIRKFPRSPVAMEVKAVLRRLCRERAKKVARDILTAD
jgi:hypothetical protein